MFTEIKTLKVEGMSCSHCEKTVVNSVGSLNGVVGVNVDLAGKMVIVEYEPEKIVIDTIKDVIEDQGYEVK